MKPLNQYIQEKLIINKRFDEKLIVNKNYVDANVHILTPKSFDELRNIIQDRYKKLGPGTKQNPVDFNDIDVSNLDSFCIMLKGIFYETKFKYIDISYWDVSNVTNMSCMFFGCERLKSVGDISKWDVSSVTDMSYMFCDCCSLNQNLSEWNVSKVTNMEYMFHDCKYFNQDISGWNVSNVENMWNMFLGCKKFNQDISKWDVSKVRYKIDMFYGCPIKEEYKPKFK